jgi:SpoIIAA-like
MITQLKNIPNTMVGFKASDEVTKDDFDKIVLPAVAELVQRTDELNYMLVLDTPIKNFTLGAWIKDALLGLNNLSKWNRAAIVSDSDNIIAFTNMFSKVMPGEFKGFTPDQLDEAVGWTSSQGIFEKQVYQAEDDSRE